MKVIVLTLHGARLDAFGTYGGSLAATPHFAIAHTGSCASTSRNAFSPSVNQKECKSATARLNFSCTAGWHDVWNSTSPSCSGGLPGESPHAENAPASKSESAVALRMDECLMIFSFETNGGKHSMSVNSAKATGCCAVDTRVAFLYSAFAVNVEVANMLGENSDSRMSNGFARELI